MSNQTCTCAEQADSSSSSGYKVVRKRPTAGSYGNTEDIDSSLPTTAFKIPFVSQMESTSQYSGPVLGGSASQIATAAIRKTLGSDFSMDDPTGYRRVLSRQFKLTTRDGVNVAEYTPSGYSGVTHTADLPIELSLFHNNIQSRVNQLKKELTRLKPMCGSDENCCEDIRGVISDRLDEFANVIGSGADTCTERAEFLLDSIVNDECNQDDQSDKNRLIGILRTQYIDGPHSRRSKDAGFCCSDDTQRLAEYELIRSGLADLRRTWKGFRINFLGKGKGALSANLTRLRKMAAVLGEDAINLVRGLNQSGFGPAQRDLESLSSSDSDDTSVGCFLRWSIDLARVGVPTLIANPGLGGFTTLRDEARRLARYSSNFEIWVQSIAPDSINPRIKMTRTENTHSETASSQSSQKKKSRVDLREADVESTTDSTLQAHLSLESIAPAVRGLMLGIPFAARSLSSQLSAIASLAGNLADNCS